MNDGKTPQVDFRLADPAQFARNMAKVFEQAAQIARNMAETPPNPQRDMDAQVTPVEQVVKTLGAVAQSYASDPQKLMDAQIRLWASYGELWQSAWRKFLGEEVGPVAAPERGDKRFTDKDWQQNTIFDFLKQFYLLSARWASDLVEDAEGLDDHTRHKARFYVEQIANAVSPSN
ncbi:MAG: class I poly(R)-hydroxyalkanoic acid synthase, partial [Alphaproteobacteria bacterium]